MKKLQELYDEIIKIKGVNKAKVLSWAEDIRPKYKRTVVDDGFVLEYTATFLIQAIPQDNQIMERIAMFLSSADKYDSEPIFNTDVVNKGKIDLQLQVDIEEQANFVANAEGDWLVNGVKSDLVYDGFDLPEIGDIIEFDGADNVES
jgi:hypothetical protein